MTVVKYKLYTVDDWVYDIPTLPTSLYESEAPVLNESGRVGCLLYRHEPECE